jgi:hypothetical protein
VFSDMRYNYCDLSVGFPDKMSKWMHQARQILRLACAALEREGRGFREAEQKGTDRNYVALEGSNLTGLAMRVMVSLTDSSTWKCFARVAGKWKCWSLLGCSVILIGEFSCSRH